MLVLAVLVRMNRSSSLIPPVRILRMFQVPQRTAAPDLGLGCEVVLRRWRRNRPFKCPCIPGIISRRRSAEIRDDQVVGKDKDRNTLDKSANGGDEVQGGPAPVCLVGVDRPRHSKDARDVHGVKADMKSDNEQPEMPFPE